MHTLSLSARRQRLAKIANCGLGANGIRAGAGDAFGGPAATLARRFQLRALAGRTRYVAIEAARAMEDGINVARFALIEQGIGGATVGAARICLAVDAFTRLWCAGVSGFAPAAHWKRPDHNAAARSDNILIFG